LRSFLNDEGKAFNVSKNAEFIIRGFQETKKEKKTRKRGNGEK